MNTVDQENVSAALTVAVPAGRVVAVLADPATHGPPETEVTLTYDWSAVPQFLLGEHGRSAAQLVIDHSPPPC